MTNMLEQIASFNKGTLAPTNTVEKDVCEWFNLKRPDISVVDESTNLTLMSNKPTAAPGRILEQNLSLTCPRGEMHGQCYGFEDEQSRWEAPRLAVHSAGDARPGYNTMSASEYLDTEEALQSKVRCLADLIRKAKRPIYYCGAGLSTSSGISDYASSGGSLASQKTSLQDALKEALKAKTETGGYRSPMCAQPSTGHRVLVGLQRAGHLHRLIQQNHDGLPQKAGMPQHVMNEIHGACHSPDNPVVPMSGSLRSDLFADLLDCEATADLSVAVGTSLCGMNADRCVATPAEKAAQGQGLGAVIISLQRTKLDGLATLRIFAPIDTVFDMLAKEMSLADVPAARPKGEYFCPPVLRRSAEAGETGEAGEEDMRYILHNLRYDAAGQRTEAEEKTEEKRGGRRGMKRITGCITGVAPADSTPTNGTSAAGTCTLDLRDGARVVIPTGPHAGAVGEVDGYDREGNPRCRFMLKLKQKGNFRVPHQMMLGTWWLQAAVDATVAQLPLVNEPAANDDSNAAKAIRQICAEYGPTSNDTKHDA